MEHTADRFDSHIDLIEDTESLLNDIMRKIGLGPLGRALAGEYSQMLDINEDFLCSSGAMNLQLRQRIDDIRQLLRVEYSHE